MIAYALGFGYLAVALALLFNLWRTYQGPTVMDRMLAIDTLVINIIIMLTLFGIDEGVTIYFEVSLLFAMLGFISTVAYCRFILRGDVIE